MVELLRWRSVQHPDRLACTFLLDGEANATHLTYQQLDSRARAIAAALQARAEPGERALLCHPAGLEFIAAFFGCLYAGILAVPAFPPDPGRARRILPRLRAIAQDAQPLLALCETIVLGSADEFLTACQDARIPIRLATDQVSGGMEEAWRPPSLDSQTLAFLQYTSGSTASPRGVMVSHGNLLANTQMIRQAFDLTEQMISVGWLPLYHDMGLIGNVLSTLYVGGHVILMAPSAFLQRPIRWLQAISRYRATMSGGPDSAYALCVHRVPPEGRAELDLSSWRVAINGAEPIRQETLVEFASAFGPHGFRRSAFYPCYGLAEATLLVTGGGNHQEPVVLSVQRTALEQNRVVPASSPGCDARPMVCCGQPAVDDQLAIVYPESL
jgi:acyl-CoA synthetase (AMP-forming)/AMP-acid ligase II